MRGWGTAELDALMGILLFAAERFLIESFYYRMILLCNNRFREIAEN